ncbi:hypothetical protein BH09BAC3_BH09BAC3_26760 [soil metagenome]
MNRIILYISYLLVVPFFFGSCGKSKERSQEQIEINHRVIDSAGLLSSAQEQNLLKLIQGLEKSVGSQIAVIILNTLNGQNIDTYSIQKSEELSLGRDLYKDGVLITVVYQDRQTRIEVSSGLEKILRDEITAEIIKEKMLPNFKEKRTYEGIYQSITTIIKLIEENKALIGQTP